MLIHSLLFLCYLYYIIRKSFRSLYFYSSHGKIFDRCLQMEYFKEESVVDISIIGGSDGPTSIFLAGKVGFSWINIFD